MLVVRGVFGAYFVRVISSILISMDSGNDIVVLATVAFFDMVSPYLRSANWSASKLASFDVFVFLPVAVSLRFLTIKKLPS